MPNGNPDRQALARLCKICRYVDELIRLVPYVLPIIGEEPAASAKVSFPTVPVRRDQIDELLAGIAPWEEWVSLFQALPRRAELELLARTIDGLRERFEAEDQQHQAELGACFEDCNAQRARGVKSARLRLPAPPERRIYREELDCIKSCLSLVTEVLDLKQGETATTTPAVEATLELIPRAFVVQSMILFLAAQPGRKAKLKDICKHLYKTVNKKTRENTALLIKRASAILDKREAPLRLVRDGDEVKLINVDIAEAT
jgi:hypothetical protein